MPHRMPEGGVLIDRSRPIRFRFNGEELQGYVGDTLASALMANDKVLLGRSFKYHRPRGLIASGAEEPNALLGVGEGGRFEPNQRATMTELYDGLVATSQNHWPSLEFDIGAMNAAVANRIPVFSAGFYYKTFMYPRAAWKHVYEPFIRHAAGLGQAPTDPDPDVYEHYHTFCDVLVVGGGVAGLMAARRAAEAGAEVLLIEQTGHWGGRALTDTDTLIDGQPADAWAEAMAASLAAMPNVRMRTRIMGAGGYDHGWWLLYERVAEHSPGEEGMPRHRLWKVRAKQCVVATGAIERPLTFAENDKPGVMLASAVRDYIRLYGVRPARSAVVVANNDDAYRTALSLHRAGATVKAVLDTRAEANGALPGEARALGIPVRPGYGIAKVEGTMRVETVRIAPLADPSAVQLLVCDLVAMSGGWSPVVHLFSHGGGKLRWEEEMAMFRPEPERGAPIGPDGSVNTRCAGAANGALAAGDCLSDAVAVGDAAAEALGRQAPPAMPEVAAPAESPMEPHWFTPASGKYAHGNKHFVDFQNDVTAADIRLAAREGYESVEHTKRYTTLGMATDQGKTSNINGLALLAEARGEPIPAVGTTTFRPPYMPISLGSIAGRSRGDLFKVIRETPMHAWHAANGGDFEPVGDWFRPYCYRRAGEDRDAAVAREVLNARGKVGLLDATTLGKIVVKGPDAPSFLDLIYTNMMSSLKIGACRYGLMCNENGFLFDDGVVVRMAEDEYLLHTTTGGADRVHGHLEEWLQTEWWDLQVFTQNVTEQWAQIAIAGPQSRATLAAAGLVLEEGTLQDLAFMRYAPARISDLPVRLYRISFSGELAFELACPASAGMGLWERLLAAGADHGIQPYGTEALHVMRAEKGFIMIGDETDGTVTPQDLGLSWAVSKKKADFIGKRAFDRIDITREDRKQLVGLLTEDPTVVLPDGAHAVAEVKAAGQPMKTIGHVTSTYRSPVLGRSIAMALIERGRERMGEVLDFPLEGGSVIRATVSDPVFYDKEGARNA
ncbi:MAG: sarcosine oxidase subunit alpha family protein [Pseudomonadota bacterium]